MKRPALHKLTDADRRRLTKKARNIIANCGPEVLAALARVTARACPPAHALTPRKTAREELTGALRSRVITKPSRFNPE